MEKFTLPPLIRSHLTEELAVELAGLAQPTIEYELAGDNADPAASQLGGHPFMASDEEYDWPLGSASGLPMTFLLQINFADLPLSELDLPSAGMLQWFVDGEDDVMGLSWEEDATGQEGLTLRWLTGEQLAAGSASRPGDELPYDEESMTGPLEDLSPRSLTFKARTALPYFGDLSEGLAGEGLSEELDEALSEIFEDEAAEAALADLMMPENSIGGTPVFVQGDPRARFPAASTAVVVQMGSMDGVTMWGDVGTGQVFGSIAEFAKGDFSSAWWDWACY